MSIQREKTRLDDWLVRAGHYPSRARARDAIKRGCVTLGTDVTPKPSRTVTDPEQIRINDPAQQWVSRAALKLIAGLEETGFDPNGLIGLDIGASTGGFTQVLLARGARHVYAVDVGHDQMDRGVSSHSSVSNLEGLNARKLLPEHIDGASPQIIVSDVSFISLKLALPPALNLAAVGAKGIFLVKPQFEVGKEHIGRGGIVRDREMALAVAEKLADWLDEQPDWKTFSLSPSPIPGGDGNLEYLLAGVKHGAN